MYVFFRDHLLFNYADRAADELNGGLLTALLNGSLPIVIDLLEHGAILVPLQQIDSLIKLLYQRALTIFVERGSHSFKIGRAHV